MIGVANVGRFQSAAPSLNNVRVSSAWLPSSVQPALDGVPMRTWGSSTNTFKYNAGLVLNSKVRKDKPFSLFFFFVWLYFGGV